MNIVKKQPCDLGCYPAIQTWRGEFPPEDYAVWPEELDTATFYEYNGFVNLTFEEREVEVGQETEKVPANDIAQIACSVTVCYVTACEGNVEAWEAWKATLPEDDGEQEPDEPEPAPTGDLEERVTNVEQDVADLTAAIERGLSL